MATQSTLDRFHFPSEDQLTLLKFPQTRKDIVNMIYRLKRLPENIEKKIKFIYSVLSPNAPVRRIRKQVVFKIYFNCCHLKPRLVFKEVTKDHFVLDESRSDFYHEHQRNFKKRVRLAQQAQKHSNYIQREKRVREIPNYREEDSDEVKMEQSENSPQRNTIARVPFNQLQTPPTLRNQVDKQQIFKDLPKFRKQYRSQNSISDDSIVLSSKKKKIYKSRLLFDRRFNDQAKADRPWIFKPHKDMKRHLRRVFVDIEEVKIQMVDESNPMKDNFPSKPEKLPPMSYLQLFNQLNIEQPKITRQNKFSTEKMSDILIIPTKNENVKFFDPRNFDANSSLKKNVLRSQDNTPQQIENEGIQDPQVSLTKAVYHTFQWFKDFSSKIFERRISQPLNQNSLQKIRKELKRSKPFSRSFEEYKGKNPKFKAFWEESNYLLLKTNNFFDHELSSFSKLAANTMDTFSRFCNKLFITKRVENIGNGSEGSGKLLSDAIYLTIHPFKLLNDAKDLQIMIAYQLSTKFEAKLIWFSIFEPLQSEKVSLFTPQLKERLVVHSIVQILLKSINFMRLTRVHFVYTIWNKNLLSGLNQTHKKIQEKELNVNFSFSMHIQCVERFLELEDRGSEGIAEILRSFSDNLKDLQEQGEIGQENLYFKKFFERKNKLRKSKKNQVNPRQLFQNFKLLREKLQISKQELPLNKDKVDISFLSSQFYPEKEKVQIRDPVNEINKTFSQINAFEEFEELFPFLLTIFNANFNKGLRILEEHLIIPSNFMWKENQLSICKNIFVPGSLEKQYWKNQIFKTSVLEFENIVKNCPRLIIQTIYHLVYFASSLSLTKQKKEGQQSDMQTKQYKIFNSQKQMNLYVFRREKGILQNDSTISDFFTHAQNEFKMMEKWKTIMSEKKSKSKGWHCECKFYEETGIPCEHEIFCAMMFKTSVYDEINGKWKESA